MEYKSLFNRFKCLTFGSLVGLFPDGEGLMENLEKRKWVRVLKMGTTN